MFASDHPVGPDAFVSEVEALAGVRTRDLNLPAEVMSAYLAHTWRSRKKINVGWMGWAAAINAFCALLTPSIAPADTLDGVMAGRIAITALLVMGALAIHMSPRPGAEGAITIAVCLGVFGGAAVMALQVEPQLAERYIVHATFLCGTAVAVARIAWRDTMILAAAAIAAIVASMAALPETALSIPEKIQMAAFYGAGLLGLLLARRAMNKLQYRVFVLSANDRLKMDAIERANGRLHAMARTDPLTEVSNRRHFDEMFGSIQLRADRRVALFMIDIDHFKRLNDTLGHEAGDECLKAVAGLIRVELRQDADFLARFGGEEFVAVLPGLESGEALAVAERVRRAVEARGIPNPLADGGILTVSLGVSVSPPARLDLMLALADAALYEAKSAGRNAVRLGAAKALRVA